MKSKKYEITLEIDCDHVVLTCPSGRYWKFEQDSLPKLVHDLTSQCLRDDSGLCQSMANRLKVEPEAS